MEARTLIPLFVLALQLTLLTTLVTAVTYSAETKLTNRPKNISEAVLKLLKPRTTPTTFSDDDIYEAEASEPRSVQKSYTGTRKRPLLTSPDSNHDEYRNHDDDPPDKSHRDSPKERRVSSNSYKHYRDDYEEHYPEKRTTRRRKRPSSSKNLDDDSNRETSDYDQNQESETKVSTRSSKTASSERHTDYYDEEKSKNSRPLEDESFKDSPDYDEDRRDGTKSVWVKGKTESKLISQSDSPVVSYEVYPKAPARSFKGSRVFSKLRLNSKRLRPLWFSSGKGRRPRKKLPRRLPKLLRKLKFRRRKPKSRRPPPPSKSTIRKPRAGKTPPDVMKYCLMYSDRCSWSERDKRLLLLDESVEDVAANFPHNEETPTELMKYCVRNSMHCHWSQRDKRWYLNDGIDKEDPEP